MKKNWKNAIFSRKIPENCEKFSRNFAKIGKFYSKNLTATLVAVQDIKKELRFLSALFIFKA